MRQESVRVIKGKKIVPFTPAGEGEGSLPIPIHRPRADKRRAILSVVNDEGSITPPSDHPPVA